MVVNHYVERKDYFNADVLLINPKFFGENLESILGACKFVYDNKFGVYEQDVLNYLFSKKYLKLPYRFNMIVGDIRVSNPRPYRLEKGIYHFAGWKPYFDTDDVFNRLLLECFLKTPWATVDVFGNISKATEKLFRNVNNNLKSNLLHITNLLARRERAFFFDKKTLNTFKRIFAIKDDELIIDASDPNALKNLIQALNQHRGRKAFFILSGNYSQVAELLKKNNFVEGMDFINAIIMLSEQQGMIEYFVPYSQTLFKEI